MTQMPYGPPPFVGPPPQPPRPPQEVRPAHVLHLLLTLITFGLWVPIWIMIGMNANAMYRKDQQRYAENMAIYRQAYDDWQRRYHQVYGTAPHPMQY